MGLVLGIGLVGGFCPWIETKGYLWYVTKITNVEAGWCFQRDQWLDLSPVLRL
jgi:hypothetical protein